MVDRAPVDFAALQRQVAELDAELAETRYSASSPDRVVTATVTGQGKLVDLTIADSALDGPHADSVGLAVVQAVAAARAASSAEGTPQLRAALDPNQTWEPRRAPQHARPAPAEYEESFENIDFLDDPHDDEEDGDRW